MKTAAEPFHFSKEQVISRDMLKWRGLGRRLLLRQNGGCYSFFWARNAIYHGLKALGIAAGDHVLVPAYICRAAIEPIVAYGAQVDFYRIRLNGQVDTDDMESRIRKETRALLAVHYFGFPQAIGEVKEVCDNRGISLIEDCAHVLIGEIDGKPMGSFGDMSVFSWRKFLPLFDGGELVLKRRNDKFRVDWSQENILLTIKMIGSIVEEMVRDSSGSKTAGILCAHLRGLKGFLGRQINSMARRRGDMERDSGGAHFEQQMVNVPMSRVSKWVLRHSDVAAVIRKRRNNYIYLTTQLRSLHGTSLLHPNLSDGHCPWVLPLFFEAVPDAHIKLRQCGIPAVTWGGVRHGLIRRGAFGEVDRLYDNLVFLPIHQNLRERELDLIAESVQAVLRDRLNAAASDRKKGMQGERLQGSRCPS